MLPGKRKQKRKQQFNVALRHFWNPFSNILQFLLRRFSKVSMFFHSTAKMGFIYKVWTEQTFSTTQKKTWLYLSLVCVKGLLKIQLDVTNTRLESLVFLYIILFNIFSLYQKRGKSGFPVIDQDKCTTSCSRQCTSVQFFV